ncbi:MAG: transketolase [Candidatus Paceibacterota bacterium]|jgi:transketolase
MLSQEKIKDLEIKANSIRKSIIEMLVEVGSGHPGGALGMADIFTALYFGILKHDPKNPLSEKRDRLVLSNGHICPVLYATMAHSGYFPLEELMTLRKLNSRLQGHPHRDFLPLVETSSGPLGEGLSQAVGMALGLRLDDKKNKVYCLMSDGEFDEGQTWEALLLAGKNLPALPNGREQAGKLENLIIIIDRNKIQLDGNTEDILPLEPLKEKLEAFNLNVLEIDGNNFEEIFNGIEKAQNSGKASIVIAHTIPGKGVKEFENDYKWHGKTIDKETGEKALNELSSS